jgi:hypothetical protein
MEGFLGVGLDTIASLVRIASGHKPRGSAVGSEVGRHHRDLPAFLRLGFTLRLVGGLRCGPARDKGCASWGASLAAYECAQGARARDAYHNGHTRNVTCDPWLAVL